MRGCWGCLFGRPRPRWGAAPATACPRSSPGRLGLQSCAHFPIKYRKCGRLGSASPAIARQGTSAHPLLKGPLHLLRLSAVTAELQLLFQRSDCVCTLARNQLPASSAVVLEKLACMCRNHVAVWRASGRCGHRAKLHSAQLSGPLSCALLKWAPTASLADVLTR